MAGEVKRKFQGELMQFNKRLKKPLRSIKDIMPARYSKDLFLEEFKNYYFREWNELNEMYILYKKKDDFLINCGKKRRYNLKDPDEYILSLPQVKNWFSVASQQVHEASFSNEYQLQLLCILNSRKNSKKAKYDEKNEAATKFMQTVDPLYIDAFIAAYHKKGIETKGKIEIFSEIKKFNTDKAINFFYKLNDSERNNQIRYMAFKHLQGLGKYVKLRKGFDGKKKSYMTERDSFQVTPEDLWTQISKDSIQNIKVFDVFISHSLKDHRIIPAIIKSINLQGYSSYCDWTSDNDFLRRDLVSDYTKMILRKRLEQSKSLLLVKSVHSLSSEWVAWELDQFSILGRPIFYIDIDSTNDERLANLRKLNFNSELAHLDNIEF